MTEQEIKAQIEIYENMTEEERQKVDKRVLELIDNYNSLSKEDREAMTKLEQKSAYKNLILSLETLKNNNHDTNR